MPQMSPMMWDIFPFIVFFMVFVISILLEGELNYKKLFCEMKYKKMMKSWWW